MNTLLRGMVIISMFILGGCAPTKNAIYLDPAFHQKIDRKLYILPPVDLRVDKSTSIDLESDIRKRFSNELRDKGYKVELLTDFGGDESMPPAAVAEMSVDELCALGPPRAQSLVVVYLNDASSKYTVVGYTFKVEVTAMLLNKNERAMLWKDKGVTSNGQGGLISGLTIPWIKYDVLSRSINLMSMSFPKRIKTSN